MTILRMVLYLLGASTAMALAGQFWIVRSTLSRMLSFVMFVWALNCLYALLLVLIDWLGLELALAEVLSTAGSVLIGLTPMALYIVWNKNGRDRNA